MVCRHAKVGDLPALEDVTLHTHVMLGEIEMNAAISAFDVAAPKSGLTVYPVELHSKHIG